MSSQTHVSERINIQPYAEANTGSALLAGLAEAQATGAETPRGWWDQLCAEHLAGTLPTDQAVAAYYVGLYEGEFKPHASYDSGPLTPPEKAAHLKAGDKVASVGSWSGGFISDMSGELKTDVISLLGNTKHPDEVGHFAKVDFGLQFTDRRDIRRVEPTQIMHIGAAAISEGYQSIITSHAITASYNREIAEAEGILTPDTTGAIVSSAIMTRFDLIDGVPAFEDASRTLAELAFMAVHPRHIGPKNLENLKLLPFMHILDPVAAEKRIQAFAESHYASYASPLATAVAGARSEIALNSLSPTEVTYREHDALAELQRHRHLTSYDHTHQVPRINGSYEI